jgi:hypothetical protein
MGNLKAEAWLDREDSVCREGRLSRLKWLAELMPEAEGLIFPGGLLAKCLFEEARYCYAYGPFLGATLLGMAYMEHTLAALFYAAGRSDLERATFSVLLREAVALGWLPQNEFEAFDRARNRRNPISHFRRPLHEETFEYRSAAQREIPYSIVEEDARHVMQAVFGLLARNVA